MKNKKALAIALSIAILTSSFSGVFISYAKNETIISKDTNNLSINNMEDFTSLAPTPVITELEPEINNQQILDNTNAVKDNGKETVVLYQGQKMIDPNKPNSRDMFNIDKNEVIELMEQGHSIQEILEADEIGNEICEDPKVLLKRKDTDKKTLKEIKKEILQERNDKSINYLKGNYQKEYEKIKSKQFTEDETYALLVYMDVYNLQLTDDLINEYKKQGKELFKKDKKHKITSETKKKYELSDIEAEGLTEEKINTLEKLAKKVNKPAEEIIKAYINNNN